MLDTTFAALADPTRRAILNLLANQELSVGEVVNHFDIAQSGISRHLKVLERAELIERRREGQRRICCIKTQSLEAIDQWIEPYRHHWGDALERLEKTVMKRQRPI